MQIDVALGLIWFVVFLYSTVCHEAAHAWSAYRLGDDTAYRGGQVSLDPIPHVRREPFGMIVVPILSFFLAGWMIGWASAPYDPQWAQRHPRRAAWMAMAGPAANLCFVLAAGTVIALGLKWGWFQLPAQITMAHLVESAGGRAGELVALLVSIIFSLNLLLFVFNLIPVPPLDGASFPLLFLPAVAIEKYQEFVWNPALRIFGIFIAWHVFQHIYPAVRAVALRILYAGYW